MPCMWKHIRNIQVFDDLIGKPTVYGVAILFSKMGYPLFTVSLKISENIENYITYQ